MKIVIRFLICFFGILKVEAQEISVLNLKQAFMYKDSKNVPEFSGLCLKEGSLYSINDKGKNYLYKLSIDTNNSTFVADGIEISTGNDFEGICYYQNSFFVVDEKGCKLYKIIDNDIISHGVEFLSSLKDENLIYTEDRGNAQIESFSILNDTTFLIATEREKTTLAMIDIYGKIVSKKVISNQHYSDSCLPATLLGKDIATKDANSFSDLCTYAGKAYLLERKKELIYVVDFSQKDSFVILKTLSFKNGLHIYDECHEFYGAAEGIAVDDKYIYIILDNNNYKNGYNRHDCNKKGRTLFQFYNN